MAKDGSVTYPVVERACNELLARGQKPSRPAVQALLETDEYLGRKGSNAVVQQYLNEFWDVVAKNQIAPPRKVEGMPAEYVGVLDRALFELVNISREMAAKEVAAEREALKSREAKMDEAVQTARDAAAAADQLRIRAEGERNAVEQRLRDLTAELGDAKRSIQSGQERESRLAADVRERDVQIRHLDAAVTAAKDAGRAAQAQHETEVRRLLQQVDDARQSALKEANAVKALNARVSAVEQELATTRARLDGAAEQVAGLQKDVEKKAALITEKSNLVVAKETEISTLNRRLLTMEVQVDAANQQRASAEDRLSAQTEELGRLRGRLDALGMQDAPGVKG